MSQKQQRARSSATRQKISWEKRLRRRARRAGKPAAALTAVAMTLAVAPGVAHADGSETIGMIKDIAPGSADAIGWGAEFQSVGDTLFFTADDGTHGLELWASDGTEAGTVLLKDINPNPDDDPPYSGPQELTAIGGTLFFTADDGVHGRQIWKSDGTPDGTVMVKNMSSGRYPGSLTAAGQTLFFNLLTDDHGWTLWKSDGTEAGTARLKDMRTYRLTAVGNTLFFGGDGDNHGLWKSNGTEAGTIRIKEDLYGFTRPKAVGNTLYFEGEDDIYEADIYGGQLWKSDGTEAGTVLVKDINPTGGAKVSDINPVGDGTFFFRAFDGTHGFELWKSDGTESGTAMVKDINPGHSGLPYGIYGAVVGGTLVFEAMPTGSSQWGDEFSLWKSDGTEAGTTLLKDISMSGRPVVWQDEAYFVGGSDEAGNGLWKTDGTTAGTVLVAEFGASPRVVAGDQLFLVADDGIHGNELWRTGLNTPVTALANTARPAISGTARVGAPLTASAGSWNLGGVSVAYQWKANGTVVGANTSTYTPTASDLGKAITVTVTATTGRLTKAATSLATRAVAPGVLARGAAPVVGGKAKVGKKVKAVFVAPAGTSVAYAWQVKHKGKKAWKSMGTASSLKLKKAWKGGKVRLLVTVKKAGYTDLGYTVNVKGKVK